MKEKRIQTILLILLTFGLVFFLFFEYKEIQNLELAGGDTLVEGNIPFTTTSGTGIDGTSGSVLSGYHINSGSIFLKKHCDYSDYSEYLEGSEYSVIQIFDKQKNSPADFSAFRTYTNRFQVDGTFEELYVCISSNVVERRQNDRFFYTTYVLFNEPDYAGHIRVGYSPTNNIMYDKSSSPNEQFLDGRFWGSESPKIYQLDISEKLIVANWKAGIDDKKWNNIYPIKRFNQGGIMSIGGFVNATNQEGVIEDFLLIYKGGSIAPIK